MAFSAKFWRDRCQAFSWDAVCFTFFRCISQQLQLGLGCCSVIDKKCRRLPLQLPCSVSSAMYLFMVVHSCRLPSVAIAYSADVLWFVQMTIAASKATTACPTHHHGCSTTIFPHSTITFVLGCYVSAALTLVQFLLVGLMPRMQAKVVQLACLTVKAVLCPLALIALLAVSAAVFLAVWQVLSVTCWAASVPQNGCTSEVRRLMPSAL